MKLQAAQTNSRKKLLYVMGIDWNWIYQRPQIIAEYLSRDYEVTVVYPVKLWDTPAVRRRKKEALRYLRIWTLPFQRKLKVAGWAADRYGSLLLKICRHYQYVYIDYPSYIKYIPADYAGCLIYDCIDDHAQMCASEKIRREIEKTEQEAVLRSSLLVVSSMKLKRRIEEQSGGRKAVLVRNGTDFRKVYDAKESCIKGKYTIGYIGTIAEWFDEELLAKSAGEHPELSYHLIGPCMGISLTAHRGISYEGVVEHGRLQSHIKDYDCLIMPFVVNEIVKSVDPVKLYDYIAFGKCIVSVWYEELKHFEDYVYFYRTYEEYDQLMRKLIRTGFPPKYNVHQQENFLEEHSWQERYGMIVEALRQSDRERQTADESHECIRNQTGGNQNVSAGKRTGTGSGGRKRGVPDGAASGNA